MRIFRISVAVLIAALLLPLLPLFLAISIPFAANCPIGWEDAPSCLVLGKDIGPAVDGLMRIGVSGLLTGRLAMLMFAIWTLIELVAICLRRPSRIERRPVAPTEH